MSGIRADLLLVDRGLVESRTQAQRLIMAGQVYANGERVLKPASTISAEADILIEQGPPFVSRGGDKLQAALTEFNFNPSGLSCADVGASTGGFTDCLLQNGANQVYAIDVGQGILHWKIRQDKRVVVMENTNARYVERLPEAVDLVTIDASFISLKILLPVVQNWLKAQGGNILALIKPQFEAGRADASKGSGVIRDPIIHRRVLLDVLSFSQGIRYGIRGLIRSPLLGPKGNIEFFTWLVYPRQAKSNLTEIVDQVVDKGESLSPPTL